MVERISNEPLAITSLIGERLKVMAELAVRVSNSPENDPEKEKTKSELVQKVWELRESVIKDPKLSTLKNKITSFPETINNVICEIIIDATRFNPNLTDDENINNIKIKLQSDGIKKGNEDQNLQEQERLLDESLRHLQEKLHLKTDQYPLNVINQNKAELARMALSPYARSGGFELPDNNEKEIILKTHSRIAIALRDNASEQLPTTDFETIKITMSDGLSFDFKGFAIPTADGYGYQVFYFNYDPYVARNTFSVDVFKKSEVTLPISSFSA